MDNNDNKLKEIVTEAAFVKCKLIVILERHRVPSVVNFVVYSMKRESENNFFVESESEDGNPLLQCGLLIMRLDVQCQALLRLSAVWRWNERKCPRIIQIQTNELRQETKQESQGKTSKVRTKSCHTK